MYRFFFILSGILLFSGSCTESVEPSRDIEKSVSVKIQQSLFRNGAMTDEDNLESEQIINTIALFLTEPSSKEIALKYINVGSMQMEGYRLLTLPLRLTELEKKDIYLITNYGNIDFSGVTTLDDIEKLNTPTIDKNHVLNPEEGFCMYGELLNFDFTNPDNSSAMVSVERTCAKYRITLTFPENPDLSTDNTFVVANEACYTHIVDDLRMSIPDSDYFTLAQPVALKSDGAGGYVNTVYMYEAEKAPKIYLYTRMNNSLDQQEFSAELPIPYRNYIYDIDIRIYENNNSPTTRGKYTEPSYKIETIVRNVLPEVE